MTASLAETKVRTRPVRDDAALHAELAPVLARIGEGAGAREDRRELPFAEVAALRDVGFTRLTVPVENGGEGRGLRELVGWLVELAAADSNLTQLLRAHFGLVEAFRSAPPSSERTRVLDLAGSGAIFGNASHERSGARVGRYSTRIVRDGDRWVLDGTKYYSTGSLFADWIAVVAETPEGTRRSVLVPVTAEGVELVDDWDGFGQRLTGSGTTHFRSVRVPDADVTDRQWDGPSHLTALFQLILLAALAGTARAITRDAAAFVRDRTRVYSQGVAPEARLDPLVQQVVGRLSSTAFAAEALVLHAADAVSAASAAVRTGEGAAGDAVHAAEHAVVRAQVTLIPAVLEAAGDLFEVGGASATSVSRSLDRHWRNARTLGSHNPSIYQARAIGDHAINGTDLLYSWSTGDGGSAVAAAPASAGSVEEEPS